MEMRQLPRSGVEGVEDTFGPFADRARKVSSFLKALSHESRLMILCILSDGEKSVGEIEALLGLPQSVVSQQLARLRLERFVRTRRDGRQIYYRIADENVFKVIDTLYDIFCSPLPEKASS